MQRERERERELERQLERQLEREPGPKLLNLLSLALLRLASLKLALNPAPLHPALNPALPKKPQTTAVIDVAATARVDAAQRQREAGFKPQIDHHTAATQLTCRRPE